MGPSKKRGPSPNQSAIVRSGTPSGMLEAMDNNSIDLPGNISMFEAPLRSEDFK